MQLFTFCSRPSGSARHWTDAIGRAIDPFPVERFDNIESLSQRLQRPLGTGTVGVLMPADTGEITALKALGHLLRDIKIVLVMPRNATAASMAAGHALRPRYITSVDADMNHLTAVVQRLTAHTSRPTPVMPTLFNHHHRTTRRGVSTSH